MLRESSHTRLCLNIFYLNFRKELWVLIEANFSHLLHCPRFSLCFVKKVSSKTSTYRQSLRCNFNVNQTWRNINILLCRARIRLSLMQKWIFRDFSLNKLKMFNGKLIHEIKWKLIFFSHVILKYSTIPLSWYLISDN